MGDGRRLATGLLALVLLASPGIAFAQPQTAPAPPPPPAEDPTIIVEDPDAVPPPPDSEPPAEPVTPAPTDPDAPPLTDETAEVESVPPDSSGFRLSTLETKNLSLLYIDPMQTYLTPYIGRAFELSLAFHQKVFRWKPWDRTTLLLKDFSDYGNAAALASPSNMILLDVAPLSLSMETFSPGERFFTLTNHELAHVAAIDVWNKRDAFWRRFLGGKPAPIQKHPESILYNFLTSPRNLTPRWYMEGSAVFFETWMAGGLGRAQGAYDEMVFRAKVRDDKHFYSPLGLESAGTSSDFQVGANSYLYGTRFFSFLALHYGVEKTVEWLRRSEDSKAFYSSQFAHVFGRSLDSAWDDWIAFERKFQKDNLDGLAKYPLTEVRHLSPVGLGSMSRGFVDEKTGSLIAAVRYPGRIGFLGKLDLATGKMKPADRPQGHDALQGHQPGLRPRQPHGFLHRPELRLSRADGDRRRHRQKAPPADRRAHRRPRPQPRRQEPVGPPPPERLRHPGPLARALHQLQPGQDLPLWRDPVRPRHLPRRRAGLGVLRRGRRQAFGARVAPLGPRGRQ